MLLLDARDLEWEWEEKKKFSVNTYFSSNVYD